MIVLRGTMYITDNINVIYNAPVAMGTRIINLDEDGILDSNNPYTIGGTCLLPPIDAKIAESDGNERLYDQIYSNHLSKEFQYNYITALIAYVFNGGILIFFLPEFGDNTREKLIFHMFGLYGIHIGHIGDPDPNKASWYADNRFQLMWIDMLLYAGVISGFDYLRMIPVDAVGAIGNNKIISNILINQIHPYGLSLDSKIKYLIDYGYKLHKDPNVVPAIECI
jgi:hypothetical protein